MRRFELTKLLFCFVFLAFSVFSCSKKTDPTYNLTADSVKAYCLFQPGSYWIYQHGPDQIDCVYIQTPPMTYQSIEYDSDGETVLSITDCYKTILKGNVFNWCVIKGNEVKYDGYIAFDSNPHTSEYYHSCNPCFYFLSYYDTLLVGKIDYYSVLTSSYITYYDEYFGTRRKIDYMDFSFVKNIGLVEIEHAKQDFQSFTSERWMLLRYKVVQ